MSEIIGKTIQQYRIEYLLGQGGMAAVYAATDTDTQQAVAVKIMHRHLAHRQVFRDHFLREANTAAGLTHPNIVPVINWGGTNDELLLVMQLVDGLNLRQYIRQLREKSLIMPYAEAIEIIRQLADTLHYAHSEHSLIHRDVKPDNVVLDPYADDERLGYRPMLTDFGLASMIDPEDKVMMQHQPAGTYPYMSPEQTRGQGVDERTDIYALGIMLYELCTGHLPFSPKSLAEATFMHGEQEVVPPSQFRQDFPPQLEAVILKTLVKNPDARLQSARDLSAVLSTLLQSIVLLEADAIPVVHPADDEDDEETILETIEQEVLPEPNPHYDVPGRDSETRHLDCLVFYTQDGSFIVPLTREIVKIGRELDDDIRLKDNLISRNHLVIKRQANGLYTFTDNDSLNGTWVVDGALDINIPTLISPYKSIRLGEMWMQLVPKIDLTPIKLVEKEADLDIAFSTEIGEGEDTQLMGIPPVDAYPEMPPVQLSVEQLQFDRLIVYHQEDDPAIINLTEARHSIGRIPRRQIQLDDPSISRMHGRIDRLGDGTYSITDLNSTNGIWVGNQRLPKAEPSPISSKQTLRIGTFWMQFERRATMNDVEVDVESGDQIDTVVMIKPLDEDLPPISEQGISREMRSSDRLMLFSEDHPKQIIPLDKERMTIGRGSDQDIILNGRRVSRAHGLLELQKNGRIQYTDLGSTNGTWMGTTLIVANTEVMWQKISLMRLGNYWMQFVRGEQDLLGSSLLNDRYRRVGKTINRFRIDRFVAENSLIALYKAFDERSNEEVAVRVLHPELARDATTKQRFLEEGRILSRVVHPNVSRVFSFYDADNEVFMVAELITGGSLRQLIKRYRDDGRLPEIDMTLKLVLQIANGLNYAHEQGLIHRDSRPEGIVLRVDNSIDATAEIVPILTDFTLLRYADPGELNEDERTEGNSLSYLSPEQVTNRRIDIRSDIFELGIILYELLSGNPPFQPSSIADAVHLYTRKGIPDITSVRSDISIELEDLLKRALAVDPDDRYQTAGAMARALQRVLEKTGTSEAEAEALLYKTVSMEDTLPASMPLRTEPPRTAEDLEYDRLIFYSDIHPTLAVRMEGNLYTVGRDESQDIQLSGQHISRRHARIERGADGHYRIMDIGSGNGSWLGTYRLLNNVAEIWEPDETVRMSDYWVRIDRAIDYQRATGMRAYLPSSIPGEYSTDMGEPRVEIVERELEPEKIIINVENTRIEVAPGTRAVLPIEIVNQDDVVDHFIIEVKGIPQIWYTIPNNSIYLLPLNRETASIEFHPPLDASASAGAHAFEVHVSTRSQKKSAVRTQGALVISPVYNYKTELFPERIRGRGFAELFISNTGNIATTYSVQARDSEQAVRFQLEGRQYRLLPGEELLVAMQIQARKRIWFGTQQHYPFMVTVTPNPSNELSPPQVQNGELFVRPTCAIWMLAVLGILAILLIAGALFGYSTFTDYIGKQATETVVVEATGIVATETAIAANDSDGDGLSNALEAELGTFPNLADTDEDGLNDGEEIRIWNTEPLNRDTDGDNLSDGDEVNIFGTNPANADTDGDGVPDNLDSFPLLQSTPTITPQPTIPGSTGDVCPGSPIPSRLAEGMRAEVEPGGVANRIRSEPDTEAEVVAQMLPGSSFLVIGGPECDDDLQLRWWEVDFDGEIGWTAEGEDEEYYLCPPDDCEAAEGDGAGGDSSATAPDGIEVVTLTLPEPNTIPLDNSRVGVQMMANVSINDWRNTLSQTQALNVGWIKIQLNWRQAQPEGAGTRSTNYEAVISNIQIANNQGYQVLVSIAKAPDWARSITDSDGPPDDIADLVTFVDMLISDVGSNISAIEVWNEPNLIREWTGTLPFNGGGYMQLFSPVYEQIQSQAPQISVLTAGLAPTDTTDVSVNDRDFLTQMYNTGLADIANTAIGIHPFGWGNAPDAICCDPVDGRGWDEQPQFFFFNTLNSYRAIMTTFGDDSKQIWVTEFGWTSWEDLNADPVEEWMNYVTPTEQGDYILRALEIGQSLDFVGPMFIWNLNFADVQSISTRDEMAGFSLLYRNEQGDYSPRIAYSIISTR